MLTLEEIARFIEDGYVVVRNAVTRDVVNACEDVIWTALVDRGVRRDEPSTWTRPVVRLNCPEGGPFVAAGTAPALWETYDQLLGTGAWWRREGVGGTIPVRFPSDVDPGDAGWHIDGSFEGPDGRYWVNVRSKARGLLLLLLLTDVDPRGAPTRILAGSHLAVPPVLAPAGAGGMPFDHVVPGLPPAVFEREPVLATGRAGDAFVCHPFLVHAASWPHRGTRARMIAQPAVGITQPFTLRADERDRHVCPVEAAILRGLRVRTSTS